MFPCFPCVSPMSGDSYRSLDPEKVVFEHDLFDLMDGFAKNPGVIGPNLTEARIDILRRCGSTVVPLDRHHWGSTTLLIEVGATLAYCRPVLVLAQDKWSREIVRQGSVACATVFGPWVFHDSVTFFQNFRVLAEFVQKVPTDQFDRVAGGVKRH